MKIEANIKNTFRLVALAVVVLVAYVVYDKFMSKKTIQMVDQNGNTMTGEVKEVAKEKFTAGLTESRPA